MLANFGIGTLEHVPAAWNRGIPSDRGISESVGIDSPLGG
jgi:hypothetical protein